MAGNPEAGYNFKPLEELTLMDDYMFSAVMRDKGNVHPLLESILNIKISDIEFVERNYSVATILRTRDP